MYMQNNKGTEDHPMWMVNHNVVPGQRPREALNARQKWGDYDEKDAIEEDGIVVCDCHGCNGWH
jgi:hypothetical protein